MKHLLSAIALAVLPVSAAAQDPIHIVQSRGALVHLDQRIGSVLIADPAIADVQPLSEDTLFLVGKAIGVTELYVLDDDQQLIERRSVAVARSLANMRAAIYSADSVASLD